MFRGESGPPHRSYQYDRSLPPSAIVAKLRVLSLYFIESLRCWALFLVVSFWAVKTAL